jgi:hypothetical protein
MRTAVRSGPDDPADEDCGMSLGTILVIILIVALVGALPRWGYSTSWGYGPSGLVGTVLVVVIILLLFGRLG